MARLCAAAVIHISTASAVHSLAGADQGLYLKYPQACAQDVILAGHGLQVREMPRSAKEITAQLAAGQGRGCPRTVGDGDLARVSSGDPSSAACDAGP